ncbi:MAG: hypothetical protein QM638_14240 [Nocardioides sp.]|uniref:hypothetical protein n=1 Tax=Nocardioides sp. TaxID=35761 RepID=UPI0039E68E5B
MRRFGVLALGVPAALVLATVASPVSSAPAAAAAACGTTSTAGTTYAQSSGETTLANTLFTDDTDDGDAISVTGGTLHAYRSSVTKTGDSSDTENSSFYGQNAAVLATADGAITLRGTDVVTDGIGANGIFAYGGSIAMTGCSISTSADSSHGADVTGGGSLALTDVDVTTLGASSSAVATDRGGGTVVVHDSTIRSEGSRSAALYSTGAISVYRTTATSTNDVAAAIDGANSILLAGSTLVGETNGFWTHDTIAETSADTPATVTMKRSTLRTGGAAFEDDGSYLTASLTRSKVKQTGDLVDASGGGTALVSANRTDLAGAVVVADGSTATLTLTHSTWHGTADGAAVRLRTAGTWVVTADSTLTSLAGARIAHGKVTNVRGNGHTVTYDASLAANSALDGGTYRLNHGGTLTPAS